MSTTLRFDSFAQSNIRERTELAADVQAGVAVLPVTSVDGFDVGSIVYVGALGRETCERATVSAVSAPNGLTLESPLSYAHTRFDAVTSVLGDKVRVYRAPDVDGTVPATEAFSVYATRSIDPDQPNTFYTDSNGSAAYWYRHTYFNETTQDETSLTEFDPVRGDDYAAYATNDEIRSEAGFDGATNLPDSRIDIQRRAAQTEINTSLGGRFTVPFTKPVPETIRFLTIKLAAGLLKASAYNRDPSKEGLVVDARAQIMALQSGATNVDGEAGQNVDAGVSSWPDDSEPRMFSIGDRF